MLKVKHRQGIALFATSDDILCLAESRIWYVDATFKSVPNPFKQLMIDARHARYIDRVVPLAYALLNNKTEASYTRVYRIINAKYLYLTGNVLIGPDRMIEDFEY